MSKILKCILFALGGLIVMIALVPVVLSYVDTGIYKPQLEKAASEALGLDVRVGSRLTVAFTPGFNVSFDNVNILSRGAEFVSAGQVSIELALIPLFHKEVRIKSIVLKRPIISIKRYRDGKYNFEQSEYNNVELPGMVLDNLILSDAVIFYEDEQSGESIKAKNLSLEMRNLRTTGGKRTELFKNLYFTADLACREIRIKDFSVSDVKFACKYKESILTINPATMRLFGGQGTINARADFSEPVPRYFLRGSLSKFRTAEYLKTLSSKWAMEGAMDFSVDLRMRGNTGREIKQTIGGEASLCGENLTLYGNDLDREFARFKTSRNFNLFAAGAYFFAVPIGLTVTRGFGFAGNPQGSGGSSNIKKVFSYWKVDNGIAQAVDVAMSTKQNRVALKGRINFIDERFDNVTIALIDPYGCVKVKQQMYGPFSKPVVEKPVTMEAPSGTELILLKQARNFLSGGRCEVFYTGSVLSPK